MDRSGRCKFDMVADLSRHYMNRICARMALAGYPKLVFSAELKLTMMIRGLTIALMLFPFCGEAATVIGPAEFEQVWWLNNQRNIIERYHQRAGILRPDNQPLFQIDIDSTSNQTIRTSAGDLEATMSRMGIHVQNSDYLFLIDWLSLIPQPQTTEGFTYGDLVLARSWQHDEKLGYTLGGRMQTRPKTVQSGGQAVFNLTDNASSDSFGGFAHISYGDWDFGTYYSQRDGSQANALKLRMIDDENRTLTGTIARLGGVPERNISPRNELSLYLREQIMPHDFRFGVTAAALSGGGKTELSNAFLTYHAPIHLHFRVSSGLYYTRLLDSGETLRGGKLGLEYFLDEQGFPINLGFFVRRNAFGDIDAMVVRDEPVYSFQIGSMARF